MCKVETKRYVAYMTSPEPNWKPRPQSLEEATNYDSSSSSSMMMASLFKANSVRLSESSSGVTLDLCWFQDVGVDGGFGVVSAGELDAVADDDFCGLARAIRASNSALWAFCIEEMVGWLVSG